MDIFGLPIVLQIVTFLLVIGVALFLLNRARTSQKKRGETPGGIAGPSDSDLK